MAFTTPHPFFSKGYFTSNNVGLRLKKKNDRYRGLPKGFLGQKPRCHAHEGDTSSGANHQQRTTRGCAVGNQVPQGILSEKSGQGRWMFFWNGKDRIYFFATHPVLNVLSLSYIYIYQTWWALENVVSCFNYGIILGIYVKFRIGI